MNDYDLIAEAERMGLGEVHIKTDPATGLRAIIAIHSTKRGPSLGGCRCIEYDNLGEALNDALRLARGMSYKSAISNLPLGGGKAVLMKPKNIPDREAYFKSLGKFIDGLCGRYITAMDSGVFATDMDAIAQETQFVTNMTPKPGEAESDPSPHTAKGTLHSIQASVKHKLGRDDLNGLHIAIQGVGHVGYKLASMLHALGATLSVCDVSADAVQRCVDEFGATAVGLNDIYDVECDVFAPCALGAIINDNTIPRLKTQIICGAANNQLATRAHGAVLHKMGILFAPDYVVNAGGVIHACAEYFKTSYNQAEEHIKGIYDTLMTIFERAKAEGKPTHDVADELAQERLDA